MTRTPPGGSSEDPFTSRLNQLLAQLRATGRNHRWLARQINVPESTLSGWTKRGIPGSEERVLALVKAFRRAGLQVDEVEFLQLWQVSRAQRSNRRRQQLSPSVPNKFANETLQTQPSTATSKVPATFRLPLDAVYFTGRDEELEQILGLFDLETDGSTAVIISAIAGKPGVGKTALGVHLAHRVKSRFPDGSLYVNMLGGDARPVDPGVVLANVLLGAGVALPPIPDELDARAGLYREWLAAHRILIVLDNAVDEDQVRPLLPDSPGCAVIITSRARLGGLDSAHIHNLDVLEPNQAVELLARVAGATCWKAADLELAHEIVALCGFLPLAVRIIGERLKNRPYWGLRTIRDRLRDERHRLDEFGNREVRASFALSYEGRPDEEQRLFRLLGLLRGPTFTPWVAAALLDTSVQEGEELVARLVDATLLELDGEDVNGHMRYKFHDLLRLFARELLDAHLEQHPSDDPQEHLRSVLLGYLELAEEANALVEPNRLRYRDGNNQLASSILEGRRQMIDAADPIGWFASERSCLVAAVEQAYEAGLDEVTWRLAGALTGFFSRRAHWQNWQRTNQLAWAAARRGGSRMGLADALLNVGRLLIDQGRFGEAITPLTDCLAAFRTLGESRGESHALLNLGNAYAEQGQWQEAISCFDECLPILRELGDRHTEAEALQSRAILHRYQGRWQAALQSIGDSLVIHRALGDRLGEARALHRFGDVYRDRSAFGWAAWFFERCREICKDQRDHLGEARALRGLGIACRDRGLREEAIAYFDLALEIIRGLRALDRYGEARVLLSVAVLHILDGELDEAFQLATRCLPVFEEFDDRHGVADARHCLGMIAFERGRLEEALLELQEAQQTFRRIGSRLWQARVVKSIGVVHAATGNTDAARFALEDALVTFRDLDVPEAKLVEDRLRHLEP
jgi:tetratricopeptide (TPR) repeat protein